MIDGRVWHRSRAKITQAQNRALLFGYHTAPHLRQQVNWTEKLSKEVQDSLSPEMTEWIGVSLIAWPRDWHWSFTQLDVTADLGGAILHLNYLNDQFAEDAMSDNPSKTAEQVQICTVLPQQAVQSHRCSTIKSPMLYNSISPGVLPVVRSRRSSRYAKHF